MDDLLKKVLRWLASVEIFSFPRKIFGKIIIYIIQSIGGTIIFSSNPEINGVINLINKIKSETEMFLDQIEAVHIYMAVKRTSGINGDIAEVGVYKGGSAKLICEAKGNRTLHLFDTFEGLPEVDQIDCSKYYRGKYSASYEEVKRYLSKYKNVYFYKGTFPNTAVKLKEKIFSFVHLDVDIYKSTRECLMYFYPRMNKGGMIISHNYTDAPGVRKAFDEFFKDKSEPIVELSGSQCLVAKI